MGSTPSREQKEMERLERQRKDIRDLFEIEIKKGKQKLKKGGQEKLDESIYIRKLTSNESSKQVLEDLSKERSLLAVVQESKSQFKTSCFKPTRIQMQSTETCCFTSKPIQENDNSLKDIKKELRAHVENTAQFPYSVHGLVRIKLDEEHTIHGSGTLVGPDLVLTAAHNLYDVKGEKKKYSRIQFIPGFSEGSVPFGIFKVVDSYVPEEFLKTWSKEDYALLVLDGTPGSQAGYFGIHAAEKQLLKGKALQLYGYPSHIRDEKNQLKILSMKGNHQLWGMKGKDWFFDEEGGNSFISYPDILTTPGQSGSGVFYQEGENETEDYCVIGVHILGRESYNSATWLTKERCNKIKEWVSLSRRSLITKKIVNENQVGREMIKELNFRIKSLGDAGADELSGFNIPNLKTLNLAYNSIGDKGVEALSKNTSWPTLQTFDLSWNDIEEKGAEALSQNNSWTNLLSLTLRYNKIGEKGTEALSKNISWTNLQDLDLSDNNIGANGAEALSKNIS